MKLSKIFLITALTTMSWVNSAQAQYEAPPPGGGGIDVAAGSSNILIGSAIKTRDAEGNDIDYVAATPDFATCTKLMEAYGGKLKDCDYARFTTADGKQFTGMHMNSMREGGCLMTFNKTQAEGFWAAAQRQGLAGTMVTREKGSIITFRCHCMESMKGAQGKTVGQLYA
ncbi:MAG: hypothetical protein K0S08_1335 [Gammaproteobacteria bacterium]|jgi:hypothetical protein|nr:hypothetical protein [Gammaproteobacteria bacterium]